MRRYSATAGVALIGASLLTAAPAAAAVPTPPALRVASADVRLAAASILNIPLNLAIDLFNVPYNEVQAVDFVSKSLFFSGTWFVVSPTNLWGVDPGDPSHFQAATQLAIPFPALSGLGLDQNDPNGLGQQVWHTIAALLPVDKSCDAEGCTPNVPTSPITGVAGIDSLLWIGALLTGTLQLPLTSQWFTAAAINELLSPDGYTYDAQHPGYVDPSGAANPLFNIPGTVAGPNGENLMPWHDTTFNLNPFLPVQNYLDHLMADPSENPMQFPSFEQVGRVFQALAAASVVAFDPITPGSPFCPGDCGWLPPEWDYAGIAKSIGDLWPGNTVIDTWLAAHEAGTDNSPTPEQIARSIEILQQRDFWDFQNPSPPASYSPVFNLSTLAPLFHKMWTDFGFNPPPLNPDQEGGSDSSVVGPDEQTSSVNALTGGPETQLKDKVIEKDPQNTIASALGFNPAPRNSTPVEPEETSSVDALTPPTGLNQGLPPLTGSRTQTPGAAPSNDTVRKTGFVPRLVDRFLPHPSGTNTTTTGTTTDTEKTGSGAEKTGAGAEKTGSGADKTGSGAEKTGSGTEKTGSGAEKTGSDTKKTGADTKKTGADTKKTGSGSGTSTGAHSGAGSAA